MGSAIIDGVKTTCLIDNGVRVNLVMPEYVKDKALDMGSIQDLSGHSGCIPLNRCGGKITEPLGYVIIWVQIPYIPSYDEEQVALMVPDDSTFIKKCLVVLGTPTINRVIQAMKQSEMENVPKPGRVPSTHTRLSLTWPSLKRKDLT